MITNKNQESEFIPPRPSRRQAKYHARRLCVRRAGAACIEMAVIAPVIFFLLFASVEFARMMMIKQSLTNAAREGCRHAALVTTQDSDAAEQTVRNYLRGTVQHFNDEEIVRVEIGPEFEASPDSGTEITVYVEVDCADVSWLPPAFFAGAKIGGSAAMNRE